MSVLSSMCFTRKLSSKLFLVFPPSSLGSQAKSDFVLFRWFWIRSGQSDRFPSSSLMLIVFAFCSLAICNGSYVSSSLYLFFLLPGERAKFTGACAHVVTYFIHHASHHSTKPGQRHCTQQSQSQANSQHLTCFHNQ
jgi:hypothetical protein